MSDNITAYSTAVGPSSLFRKRLNAFLIDFIVLPLRFDFKSRKVCWTCHDSKLARSRKLVSTVIKRGTRVLAEAGNSGQANNDNEGQHNSVFNSCWSIFTLQETLHLHGETLHFFTLRQVSRSYRGEQQNTNPSEFCLNSSP